MSHFSLGYDALFSKDRDLQPHKAHVLLGAEDVSVSRRARHYFPLNGYLNRIAVIGPARSYDPFQRDIENAIDHFMLEPVRKSIPTISS